MKTKDANLAKVFEWLSAVLTAMPPYIVGTAQERAKPAQSHLQATPEEIAHQDKVRAMLAKQHPKDAADLDRYIAYAQKCLAEGHPVQLSQTEFLAQTSYGID
jgi:hypothetical protein